jgi:hypothetical protein
MPYEAHRTGHSFLAFSGPESTHSHGFGRLYYGAGVLYGEMGSLAGTDTELDIHPSQKTLCQTVRLYAWTVRHYIRTVWRHTGIVRMGYLGFARYVAAWVQASVIRFKKWDQPPLARTVHAHVRTVRTCTDRQIYRRCAWEAVVAQGTCLSASHKWVVTGRDNL